MECRFCKKDFRNVNLHITLKHAEERANLYGLKVFEYYPFVTCPPPEPNTHREHGDGLFHRYAIALVQWGGY